MTAWRRTLDRLSGMRFDVRRFFIRVWPLLLSLAILFGAPMLVRLNHHGRVAFDAALYLPDMVLQPDIALGIPLPRPIELFTDAPSRERVVIEYESRDGPREIEADLYTPQGDGPFHAVVFSMGAPPLELDNERLVRIAEDSARSGVVMLVPFSERLDEHEILPEEIDALVAEFEYVQSLAKVDPQKVGFFGASVGGSLALVAAADPRIAGDVDHVVSFGGAYDALEAFGAIATHHITYGGIDEEWTPRRHSATVMREQFIWALDDADDRELLERWFLDREPGTADELATLSPAGRDTYEFLANRDPRAVPALVARLPAKTVDDMEYLSPRTSIDRVAAELFIIHDRADPFIPYTESRKLEDHLRGRDDIVAHFDELRLFEHVEPKLGQRPDVIALDSTRLVFRLYQLLLRWAD
jgi:acetyl esterase/lipase